MAKPIVYAPPDVDARSQLIQRLENAPQEHAEALMDAYDILRLLHDKGIFELVKGALGSGEKVLDILTDTLELKESIRTIRNFVTLTKIIGGLDPQLLEAIESAITDNIARARNQEPPGLVKIARQSAGRGSRRALGALIGIMEAVGQNLITAEVPTDKTQRKPTTRHSA